VYKRGPGPRPSGAGLGRKIGTAAKSARRQNRHGQQNWHGWVRPVQSPRVTNASMHVPSTNGVSLMLHDLGGDGPPVLLCHATGFHGRTYIPFVAHLTDAYHVWALDFRGHGASTPPADEHFAWSGMADDVRACVAAINAHDGAEGRSMRAIGHSMGGAAILLAELESPGTIEQAYLFEPIVFPAGWERPADGSNHMAGPARKRREVFASRAEAMWRYSGRPPLNLMRADCLAAYVEFGFDDLPDGSVRLACRAEYEARTFEASGLMTSDRAAGVQVPVVVGVGLADKQSNTMAFAPATAEALPYGVLKEYSHLGHWGPLEDPVTIAVDVREFFGAARA